MCCFRSTAIGIKTTEHENGFSFKGYTKNGFSFKDMSQVCRTYLKNAFLSYFSGNVFHVDVASVVQKLQPEMS